MRGGRSAMRRSFSSSGSISTAGSHLGSPLREAGKRSCNASPKLAARGHRFPNPWVSAPREARERPTRPRRSSSTAPTSDLPGWRVVPFGTRRGPHSDGRAVLDGGGELAGNATTVARLTGELSVLDGHLAAQDH